MALWQSKIFGVKLTIVVLTLLVVAPAGAQTVRVPSAQAYYEFMVARRLEGQNDTAGALEALKRAQGLDPQSAEIQAELAGFYARQNQGEEAVAAAEAALALDEANPEAHRVLGLVYSAWSEGPGGPGGRSPERLRAQAIDHLQKIVDTPAMATDLNLQVALGRLQLRAGRHGDAVGTLEKVTSQAPFAAEPYALLAEALSGAGELGRASTALAQAAEINPRYYEPLADLYERQRRPADAVKALQGAVDNARAPSRALRLRWVGALLNLPDRGGAATARDVLTELLKPNPQDARVLYLLSTAHRQLGDYAAAESTARTLLANDPESIPGLYALVLARADQHDARGVVDLVAPFARAAAGRAKGREGEAALLFAQLGFAHQQLGEHEPAVAAFAQAHELAPASPLFDIYLVQAHLASGEFSRAIEAAAASRARHPGDERLTRLHAEALARAGRPGQGLELLEAAVAKAPESRDLVIALAELYSEAEEYDKAISVLQAASARTGDDPALRLQLGAVLEAAGRTSEAEREFRALLGRDPLNAPALNYLGYMLADRGDRLPEAVELIQRALTIEPANASYLDSLGWALFKQGKPAEAEGPLRRAADAARASSVIQEHHGDVLAALGRYDEAASAYQRALAGDGDAVDRKSLEKKLKDVRERRR